MSTDPVYENFATTGAELYLPVVGLPDETVDESLGIITGSRQFLGSDDSIQAEIGEVLTAANYVRLQGAVAAQGPSISAQGSDTNIDLNIAAKGTGIIAFGNGSGPIVEFIDEPTGSAAVNFFSVRPGANGVRPRLSANVSADYEVPDANVHNFTVAGETCFRVGRSGTGAINYLQAGGSSTFARLTAQGADTNVSIFMQSKGSGTIDLWNASGAILALSSGGASSSRPNSFQMRNAAASSPPELLVSGTDTDIDILFTPKGTGRMRFGAYVTQSDAAVIGHIEVKDAAGNVRKLAVVA